MAKASLEDYRYNAIRQDDEKRTYRIAYTSDYIWSKADSVKFNVDSASNPLSGNITLSYSYEVAPYRNDYGWCYPLAENLQQLAKNSREQLSSFANIAWRVESPDKAKIQYAMCDDLGGAAGVADYPTNDRVDLCVLSKYEVPDQTVSDSKLTPDFIRHFTTLTTILESLGITESRAAYDGRKQLAQEEFKSRQLILNHEQGHTLGLAHPHPDRAKVAAPLYTQDVAQMSYYSGIYVTGPLPNPPIGQPHYSGAYATMDILTLQRIYGANTQFRAANDVYQFDGKDRIKTIYDAGGFNSYDASSSSACNAADTVYINANPDIHAPSTVGQTGVFTAFAGPNEIIGGLWDNVIHGSVAHANQIDLSAAKGAQWVIPAGHDNTIQLNPDAYGAASLDYRSMAAFIGKGRDTVFGFSPEKDRIITDLQWKDIKLAPSGAYNMTLPNNSTHLVTNGTIVGLGRNQNIVLAGISPESINESHFQRNGTLESKQYPDSCQRSAYESAVAYLCTTTSLCSVPAQIALGTTLALKEEIYMVAKAAVQKCRGVSEPELAPVPDAIATLPKIVGKLAVNVAWDVAAVAGRTALPIASFTHDMVKSMKDGALEAYAQIKPEPVIAADIENQHSHCAERKSTLIAVSAGMGLFHGLKTAAGYAVFSVIDNQKLYPFYTVRDLAKGASESLNNPEAAHESWRKRGGKALISGVKSVAVGTIARTRGIRHFPEAATQFLAWWKSGGPVVADSGQVAANGPEEQPVQAVELARRSPDVADEVRYSAVRSPSVPRGNAVLPRSRSYSEGLAANIPFTQREANSPVAQSPSR